MMGSEEEFQRRLLATFRVEAEEHVKNITSGLLELEKAAGREDRGKTVEAVFREAHSLKGAARAVGIIGTESLCQALEGVFAALKRGELDVSPGLLDLLHQATDCLGQQIAANEQEQGAEGKARCRAIIERLKSAQKPGEETTSSAAPFSGGPSRRMPEDGGKTSGCSDQAHLGKTGPAGKSAMLAAEQFHPAFEMTGTVRVPTAKLTAVMLEAEELLSAKLAANQRAAQLRSIGALFDSWDKEWSRACLSVMKDRKNNRRNGPAGKENGASGAGAASERLREFLAWNSEFIGSLKSKLVAEKKIAERESWALGSLVNNLLADVKKTLMFPFSSLFEILPKIARDLSRDSGKEAELIVRGAELEIDRRILEEMKDPLIHLIRNCIDHGIELPAERELKKKPRRGVITVAVEQRDENIELTVSDDGAGISAPKLRAAVQRLGLRPQSEELGDDELLRYLFHSGVSTSPIITELSGRGLGLAIVREKVEKFGGSVSVKTQTDAGSSFRLILPLTVATLRGVLVRAGGQVFIIPTANVQRAARVERSAIRTVENKDTAHLNGRPLSLVELAAVLGLPERNRDKRQSDQVQMVVLCAGGASIAFAVDEVVGEQEVLLKDLGPQLSRVRNIAGATVLGPGTVAPVLSAADLLKTAVSTAPRTRPELKNEQPERQQRSVLIVEDSITSRTLLKNILEAAGYDVATAVDGVDAFTQIRGGGFHAVISDVDMPRMNGFELTAKIRADKKLAELPVVLVTALQSREDRERGIDAGANAYIVKSSFDQSNLLDVVGRLV